MKLSIASLWALLVGSLLLPSLSFGGVVHGSLVLEGARAGDAAAVAQLEIKCPAKIYAASVTIPGSYSIDLRETGSCTLSVQYAGLTASLEVISGKKSVRYDLILKMVEGKLNVKRQ